MMFAHLPRGWAGGAEHRAARFGGGAAPGVRGSTSHRHGTGDRAMARAGDQAAP
jgi:hypothetical protein